MPCRVVDWVLRKTETPCVYLLFPKRRLYIISFPTYKHISNIFLESKNQDADLSSVCWRQGRLDILSTIQYPQRLVLRRGNKLLMFSPTKNHDSFLELSDGLEAGFKSCRSSWWLLVALI